ncbi:three-helix bundle dimerization domain-containing protein [Serinicoccus marinus]|uniref:three-helix bundle dimerization domain-containing protein n=1 Tax=Serinicoccus marinus TaxID=247333 RepID=UPI003B50EB05
MTPTPLNDADPYVGIVDDLAYSYDGTFSRESIAAAVQEARDLLEPRSTIHTFLPVLVARQAREQLMAAAQAEGTPPTSSSPWGAATRARSSRASATRTGPSPIPMVSRSSSSARSATTSRGG